MNSRRRILQFLGLGSLFATAGVTLNQARAAKGMEPISPGFIGDEIHRTPRTTFGPLLSMKWEHRVVHIPFGHAPEGGIAEVMNHETADDLSQFVSLTEAYGAYVLVFRKRVLAVA